MDELQETVETLIDLDEPEALLATLRRAAGKQKGMRWQALNEVLVEAELKLDLILNPKVAGPDWRPEATAPTLAETAKLTVDAIRREEQAKRDAEAKTE
jgi:hypothetical protein